MGLWEPWILAHTHPGLVYGSAQDGSRGKGKGAVQSCRGKIGAEQYGVTVAAGKVQALWVSF